MARRSARASFAARLLSSLLVVLIVGGMSACQPTATISVTVTPAVTRVATFIPLTPSPSPTRGEGSRTPPATPSLTPNPSPTRGEGSQTPIVTVSPLPATPTPSGTPTSTATPTPEPTRTPTPTLSPQTALAQTMFMAINAERAKSGLVTPAFTQGTPPAKPQPLAVDDRLALVADAHARDMATRSYFSHTSLEGKTPEDRIREAGIDFVVATENIYMAQGDDALDVAMTWFMQDQVHRDAILNPRYNRVGVGVHIEGKMIYFVQKFIQAP